MEVIEANLRKLMKLQKAVCCCCLEEVLERGGERAWGSWLCLLPRWTYRYSMDHQSEAALDPDCNWMDDHTSDKYTGCSLKRLGRCQRRHRYCRFFFESSNILSGLTYFIITLDQFPSNRGCVTSRQLYI
jgi:hypothetical protein